MTGTAVLGGMSSTADMGGMAAGSGGGSTGMAPSGMSGTAVLGGMAAGSGGSSTGKAPSGDVSIAEVDPDLEGLEEWAIQRGLVTPRAPPSPLWTAGGMSGGMGGDVGADTSGGVDGNVGADTSGVDNAARMARVARMASKALT